MMHFIPYIATTLAQKGLEQLKNYTLVFPMQRAELYFKQQFKQLLKESKTTQAIVLPRMLTIDQLVSELSPLRQSDEIHAVCRLYSIYQQHLGSQASLSLDAFYGWGSQLLQDFNSIDMSLHDASSIIRNLSEAQALDQLNLDDETREKLRQLVNLRHADERVQAFFRHLWQELPAIYEHFVEEQRQQGLATKGACYRYVIDHFDQLLPRLDGRTMVFAGFNYLLPAERRIMQLFDERHQALFFWDYDPTFQLDRTTYQFLEHNRQQFAASSMPIQSDEQEDGAPIAAIATKSANAQVQYIRQWLQQNHHSGQRTAIVITDETILESVLYALPSELNNRVNITKGYPLKNTSTFAEVVRFLSSPQNDRLASETTYEGVLQRLSQSLHMPQLLDEDASATWQELLQQEAYCQTIGVINRFIALCQEGVLSAVSELRTMRNLLRRSLEMITLPFHGENNEEIQVIGVLETRLLDFDNLLILNVEEGVVPAKKSDHSFIPFDLRKAYQMPTHDEEATIYAYNFFRLLRRAQHITLMYSEATGEMSQKTMSRFLMQLLLDDKTTIHKYSLQESTDTSDPLELKPTQSWLSQLKPRHLRLAHHKTTDQPVLSLSPSALADYIECPREFYLKHIEHISSTEGESLILSPAELGSLFHGAIQHAYIALCGGAIRRPTVVPSSAIQAYISTEHWEANSKACMQAGMQEVIQHYNRYHTLQNGEELYRIDDHKAEAEVVRQMVYQVLHYDATHFSQLELIALEGDYRRILTVTHDGQQVPVVLGGVIDHLDCINEEGQRYLRILDYKTGSHHEDKMRAASVSDLFAKYDAHYVLQTMLYSWVIEDYQDELQAAQLPVMPQLLFTQKVSADKHIRLGDTYVKDFHPFAQEFEAALSSIITSILNEPKQDKPWKKADTAICEKSFCPFHILCNREKK